MKSKDLLKQQLLNNLSQAMKSEDENALAEAFTQYAESVQAAILDDVKMYQETADKEILVRRGVHQLTKKETEFYQKVIDTIKNPDPRQAFTGLELAFPETVIDRVLEDIKSEHELLNEVDFQNTTILTKIVVNKKGVQLATWGKLGTEVTKELEGAIGLLDLTLCKLTAFMPISKDMVDVGATWIDAYVRATLSEAIAMALETAIVTGTGKDEPIGMNRQVGDNVTVTGGIYPLKEKQALTEITAETYGELIAELAKDPLKENKGRKITEVLFIVNPIDYFKKLMPATTMLLADGTYRSNSFPFPTKVIQSSALEEGEAILGLGKKYFLGIGAGTQGGKINYSDDVRFLEDERVYLTKLYGNGMPLDNNAFLYLDISELKAAVPSVTVKGTVKTKEEV